MALAAWAALGAAASFVAPLVGVWALAGLALLGAVGVEAYALRRQETPEVVRTTTPSLAVGVANEVGLRVRNPGANPLRVRVFDRHPVSCLQEGLPQGADVPGVGWAELSYTLRPQRRGDVTFDGTDLQVQGRWGLVWRQLRVGEAAPLRVYPNYHEVIRYALLSLSDRVGQMGIRLRRRRGQGLEFKQLRDYREGDLIRQIDWKATARRRSLISREYQDERNQQIVFLVDCGRRMRAQDGPLSHFDHVLNAVLLLTYVALRQGDQVGMLTFGSAGRPVWLPPAKGAVGMSTILNKLYDLETSTAPADYASATQQLMMRQKRRALVLLVTNVREEDQLELRGALASLRTRNLVLLASLREDVIESAMQGTVGDFSGALRAAAAFRHSRERRRVHEELRQGGALVLETEPGQLPVALVNRYMDIKQAGML